MGVNFDNLINGLLLVAKQISIVMMQEEPPSPQQVRRGCHQGGEEVITLTPALHILVQPVLLN